MDPRSNDLKYTSQEFQGSKLRLIIRKGVYPYYYMDSFERFKGIELPPKDKFYSILNDSHISDTQYVHAIKVYHDLYLKSDVLSLADVFENFRKISMQYYELDPCHYFTSPGLSWDAMLKMTDIKLELIIDIDMFQFIEKGVRGGVSYIANRYGKENNKYMKEYDAKAPSKYIMYLDANNLYGWAMSQYQSAENRRKRCHRFWLRLRHVVIIISNNRTSATQKIILMALIRTLTVSTTAFERTKGNSMVFGRLNIYLPVVSDGLHKKKSTKYTWLNTKRIAKRV